MTGEGWFKRWTRHLRLARYLRRHGGNFDYHGIPVTVPERVPFAIKKKIIRGEYEEPERQLISRYLRRDLPLVELGGSLGIVSAFANLIVDPHLPYVIVEANSGLIEICRANASASGSPARIEVVHAACAYHVPEVSFLVSDNIHGNRIAQTGTDRCATVPALTLAAIVEPRIGTAPYSLIMDIEGAEWDVFENDEDVLRRCALAIIELHPEVFEERGGSVARFTEMAHAIGLNLTEQVGNSYAFLRGGT